MTTNHIEKLDPALIRPGRVDRLIEITYLTSPQMKAMFEKFYPKVNPQISTTFITNIMKIINKYDIKLSGAELQGYFMFYKDDPNSAVEKLPLQLLKDKGINDKGMNDKGMNDKGMNDKGISSINTATSS